MWTRIEDDRLDQRLRSLLADGRKLCAVIQAVHTLDGIGKLHLCHSVERVTGMRPIEAKKVVTLACSSENINQE